MMTRGTLLLTAAILAATMTSSAAARLRPARHQRAVAHPSVVRDLRTQSPAEQRIRAALAERTQIGFIDTPLQDAIDFLKELHKITILVDEDALAKAGLATDHPINLHVQDISLQSALRLMLGPHGLTYVIEDEVLKITTRARVEEKVVTHVYDVRALQQAGIDPQTLLRLVESGTSGPWLKIDGVGGAAEALSGGLVIRQTQAVHQEVADLLKQLQAFAEAAGD